jgi:hypothetical protein
MNITIKKILNQNITLVYDSLDLQTIDRNELRKLFDEGVSPTVMDSPGMLVIIAPSTQTIVQMGGNRILVTLPQQSQEIGQKPIWDVTVNCTHLLSNTKSEIIAYGFNYNIEVETALEEVPIDKSFVPLFLARPTVFEKRLDGQLLSFVPRFVFLREQKKYDLKLKPVGERNLQVQLNVHYQVEEYPFPSAERLQKAFFEEFEYLKSILPKILKGDEE